MVWLGRYTAECRITMTDVQLSKVLGGRYSTQCGMVGDIHASKTARWETSSSTRYFGVDIHINEMW